jgi:hypothetical protein
VRTVPIKRDNMTTDTTAAVIASSAGRTWETTTEHDLPVKLGRPPLTDWRSSIW